MLHTVTSKNRMTHSVCWVIPFRPYLVRNHRQYLRENRWRSHKQNETSPRRSDQDGGHRDFVMDIYVALYSGYSLEGTRLFEAER